MFRDLNKINGASVFTLNLRPGVIIYQLVMSPIFTLRVWVVPWSGFTADILTPRPDKYQDILDSMVVRDWWTPSVAPVPHFIPATQLLIKTVFCPNLKFRQLLKLTLPTPREPQELTASDQIRDNRDNVMKQRDTAWLRGLVTKQCHWPSSSSCHLEEKELLLLNWSDFNSPPLWLDSTSSFRFSTSPENYPYLVKRECFNSEELWRESGR